MASGFMNQLHLFAALAAIGVYVLGFARLIAAQRQTVANNRSAAPATLRNAALALIALGLHAWATFSAMVTDSGIDLALVYVSNYIAVVMVAVVALANTRLPVNSMNLLLFPIATVNLVGLLIVEPGRTTQLTMDSQQSAHILLSLSAYAALMTAALQSILLGFQDKQLKRLDSGFYRLLPPLETMERLLIAMLWIGTALLTLAILTGLLFLDDMFAQRVAHHTVLTTLSWCVYVGFLLGHHVFGWRGISAVRWNLSAFGLLLLLCRQQICFGICITDMTGTDVPTLYLFLSIIVLIFLSAYFSGTETAMMALNRYRLRHMVKRRHRGARKADRMLKRPDRLLGVILVGNNLVNFSAATLATIIGYNLLGDTGVLLAPWVLTLTFLIFAEVAPKTLAAERPEAWALKAVFALEPLAKVLHPAVLLINSFSNALVKPFLPERNESDDQLTKDELITVVNEGAHAVGERKNMLARLLDLETVTVNDIMVPRTEIVSINIDDDMADILTSAATSQHTLLPVYKDNFNNMLVLHLRRLTRLLQAEDFTKADLLQLARDPYYVPEATPLHTQLLNFQKEKQRFAIVVDEYGDIQGIVTLEDILEEIVGEFTSDFAANIEDISAEPDGSFLIDGMAVLRDINRALRWNLPTNGPKTLNGFVLEHLETIPEFNLCIQIDEYQIETLQIKDNIIKSLRIRRVAEDDPVPD